MCSFVGSCMICCQQSYLWIYLCVWVNSGTFVVVADNLLSVIHAVSVKRRLWTADCRLQTRGKMQTVCKMQTADCRLRVKRRLG